MLALASCAAFLLDSILESSWRPPPEAAERIGLSPIGEGLVATAVADGATQSPEELRAAALVAFATPEGLVVDPESTDVPFVLEWFNQDVKRRRLQFAWLPGGTLQQEYAQLFRTFRIELGADETQTLLRALPVGVFQYGSYVTGPLGLARSAERRFTPVTREVVAFDCTQPGCTSDHRVRLMTQATGTSDALQVMVRRIHTYDASKALLRSVTDPSTDVGLRSAAANFLFLLGDCFADSELRALVARGLNTRAAELRGALQAGGLPTRRLQAPPAAIASELDRATAVQLLLLLSDRELARVVDEAGASGDIDIPEAEIRVPRTRVLSAGIFGSDLALSKYGIQQGNPRLASLRLYELVRFVHDEEGTREDLEWQLRGAAGSSTSERLHRLLHEVAPEEAVAQLVLVSRRHARAALRFPTLESADLHLEAPPADLARVLAWKLGFRAPPGADALDHFERRTAAFRAVAATVAVGGVDEALKDRVRGEGVNFFVSVEQLLDRTVAFATWALLHDHVASARRFTYGPRAAKRFMLETLRGAPLGGAGTLSFPHGDTLTIGTLSETFVALAGQLEATEREAERHVREQLPAWVGRTPLLSFPFRHERPVLDIVPDARSAIIALLRDVPASLSAADVAGVRNRIDHWREEAEAGREFPSHLEITRVCDTFQEVVERLVGTGLYPSVLRLVQRVSDGFSRSRVEFANRRGQHALTLYEPSALIMCGLPRGRRQVALTSARISEHDDCLRFHYVPPSPYTEMWSDFPPLRLPHPTEDETVAADPDEA